MIEWYEKSLLPGNDPAYEIYNLAIDKGEIVYLSGQHQAIVTQLAKELDAWKKKVNAQMPQPVTLSQNKSNNCE